MRSHNVVDQLLTRVLLHKHQMKMSSVTPFCSFATRLHSTPVCLLNAHPQTIMQEAVNDMYQSLQRKIDRLMQLQAELAEAKVQMQHDGEGGDNG